MSENSPVVRIGAIGQRILFIRGLKVIVDSDLAEFYGVATKRLNEQVKRNRGRFPEDIIFQLTASEKAQVVANCDHLDKLKYSPVLPYAFTEHGAIMAASVLNSEKAIGMSVFVVRAFVRLRQYVLQHQELALRLDDLDRMVGAHDHRISSLVEAIRRVMSPDAIPPQRRIGFTLEEP